MICRYGRQAVLALVGAVLFLVLLHGAPLWAAGRAVTGVVVKSGFSGVIVREAGASRAVKYQTGRETVYSPRNYRPREGDTVTVRFYHKPRGKGRVALVASSLSLLKKDPGRTEVSSPAIGIIRKAGRKKIRFEFPALGQAITMEMTRGTKKSPARWRPAMGDKVRVYSATVPSRFGSKTVVVINRLEKL